MIEWNMQYVVDRLKQLDSPALACNYKAELNGHTYPSHRALVEHVVEIERSMILDAMKAGCRYVQQQLVVQTARRSRG